MSKQHQNLYAASPNTVAGSGSEPDLKLTRWFGVIASITLFSSFMATIQIFPFGAWERWAAGLAIGLLIAISRFLLSGSKPLVYISLAFVTLLYASLASPISTRLATDLTPRFVVAFILALVGILYSEFVANRLLTSTSHEQ